MDVGEERATHYFVDVEIVVLSLLAIRISTSCQLIEPARTLAQAGSLTSIFTKATIYRQFMRQPFEV